MRNLNLNKAKIIKNDEFYTQITDIKKELMHYKIYFKNKIVFCNCDNPEYSAFWEYFHINFKEFGLRKLVSTHYDKTKAVYKMEYTGGNDENVTAGVKTNLKSNGDFRNPECLKLLEECDIVVTNPPFSLFREYIAVLMEYKKQFLIIGSGNAITYKEIFPLIKNNLMWLGITRQGTGNMWFRIPDDTPERARQKIKNGIRYQNIGNSCWFTNMNVEYRHKQLILSKHYIPENYPKYDNYDVINVNKVIDIPCDYDGVMGVPITFLGKYNPEQFEIITFRKNETGEDLIFTRQDEINFNHNFVSLYDTDDITDIKIKRQNQWTEYLHNNQSEIEPVDYFYPLSIKGRVAGTMNGMINGKETYRRILIRKK